MWQGKKQYLVLLTVLLWMPAAAQAGIRVCLRQEAQAPGHEILLADVAEIQAVTEEQKQVLGMLSLGFAPAGDAERILTRQQILKVLGRAGLEPAGLAIEGAEQVRVTARQQVLDPGQVAEALRSGLLQQYPNGQILLQSLTVTLPNKVSLPQKQLRIVPDFTRWTKRPNQEIPVDFYCDNQKLRRIIVQVHLRWEGRVASATRNLPVGQVLTEGDYQWARQGREDNPALVHLAPRSLAGMRVRQPVHAGQALSRSMLSELRMVEGGEIVEVTVRGEGFSVRTSARAQQNGNSGDRIKVVHVTSKRVLIGKVIGRNKVEIRL